MNVRLHVYDSVGADSHVDAVSELIERHEESVDRLDVAAADDRAHARREAMLTVESAVWIDSPPDTLFDGGGTPDSPAGALIAEETTGRRWLHVRTEALETLRSERR